MPAAHPDIDRLSSTIAAIYDSAIDPGRWPEALEQTAGLLGGRTASIGISDAVTRETIVRTTWGVPEPYLSNYAEYVATMPFYALYAQMAVEEAKAGSAMYDMGEFRSSLFYREWAKPQGLEDVAALCLMNDRHRFGIFGVNIGDDRDLAGPADIELLRLLAPHVRRAATIGDLLDVSALSAARMEAALDILATGIMLVDTEMRILHANRAAANLLDANEGLGYASGRLSARWPTANTAIQTAVARAAQGDLAMGRAGFSLPVPRDGQAAAILHVLPIPHSQPRRELAPRAAAAIFVAAADAPPSAPVDALAALYDLSRAEAMTLEQIGAGRSPSEAAARLGVSVSTVKSHLVRVFRKTGTSRQPELVRLVGSLSLAFETPA
jgi:DNA-binding CsgD family transcriptional regulator/PAS domain-containing protein